MQELPGIGSWDGIHGRSWVHVAPCLCQSKVEAGLFSRNQAGGDFFLNALTQWEAFGFGKKIISKYHEYHELFWWA